jgi:RNA polymerase sigma factor (sigma-70 family)
LFYGYLMAIILRYTNNTHDSEELVNDSFIKIFKSVASFKKPLNATDLERSFKGWIAKIASRTAIDSIRKLKLQDNIEDLTEAEHPVSHINVTTELYANDILNLLNELPDTHRLVFNLYEIEGFTHDEIAKILNVTESSSRVFLTRAKNKLRTLYLNSIACSF